MSIIRGLGRLAGKGAGMVVGGPIQIVGELTNISLLEDIGKGVKNASEFAGDTVGQVASGAIDTVGGIINDDPSQRDNGLGQMGKAVSRTAKGVYTTAKDAVQNGGDVVVGVLEGDNEKAKKGATKLIKTAAIGILAVGVVDIVDGADIAEADTFDSSEKVENDYGNEETVIETRNDHLVGSVHPVTGIPFEENTVYLPNNTEITGVFPVFDVEYEVTMDETLYLQSDDVHFSYANQELYNDIQADPDLAYDLGLSPQDIEGLANGDAPEGYTWHHSEEPGELQLVDKEIHANTGHTGGREIWGGGEENR